MNAFETLAQLTSSQIVNCFVLGIAVAALAGATSAAVGRKSSGLRFAIWFAGLIAVASLFVLYRPLTVDEPGGTAVTVPAIPYFLWANRAPGPMRVWIPLAAREE